MAHAAETDTVFIGSSRVFHQFIPRQFDEAMRAAGQPTRSLNLGVDGMVAPESYFAVEDFLSLHPRLRWVFIELQPIQPRFPKHYDGTIRAWWWHDWKNTLLVVRASLREPYLAERSRFETLRAHAALLIDYYVRTGALEDVLSQLQAAEDAAASPPRAAGNWRRRFRADDGAATFRRTGCGIPRPSQRVPGGARGQSPAGVSRAPSPGGGGGPGNRRHPGICDHARRQSAGKNSAICGQWALMPICLLLMIPRCFRRSTILACSSISPILTKLAPANSRGCWPSGFAGLLPASPQKRPSRAHVAPMKLFSRAKPVSHGGIQYPPHPRPLRRR